MSLLKRLTNTLSCAVLMSGAALANDQDDKQYDRIEVTGEKSTSYYRDVYRQSEKDFYAAYNELMTDRSFRMNCNAVDTSGSNMRKKICQPNFVKEIETEVMQKSIKRTGNASSSAGAMGAIMNKPKVKKRIEKKTQEMYKQMIELVNANPHLYEKFVTMQTAKTNWENSKG